MDTKKLVMFCILMESHGRGIEGISPGYLEEKFGLVESSLTPDEMLCHLDKENQAKYNKWIKTWRVN